MMKIMGFIMGNKTLAAVIVIAIVAMLYMYSTGFILGSDYFDDGSPEGTLSVIISGGGNTYDVDIPVNELTKTASLMPLSAYSQTLIGIVNTTTYTVGFSMSGAITPQADVVISETESLKNTLMITGITGNSDGVYGYGAFDEMLYASVFTTPGASFTMTPAQIFTKTSGSYGDIKGDNLDGSVFTFEITSKDVATDGLTYLGMTTVTLDFVVDWDGNLFVEVTDIEGVVG